MSYDENSFLQGIAVGRGMRGRDSADYAAPTCWNDEGIYSYFYIQYPQAVSTITKGQFTVCHNVFCRFGELSITDIEIIDSYTIKVICDISSAQNSWVAITNYDNSYIKFANGVPIPLYGILFWMNGAAPWNLGYIEEIGILLSKSLTGTDEAQLVFSAGTLTEIAETLTLEPPDFNTEEQVHVIYTGGINE